MLEHNYVSLLHFLHFNLYETMPNYIYLEYDLTTLSTYVTIKALSTF